MRDSLAYRMVATPATLVVFAAAAIVFVLFPTVVLAGVGEHVGGYHGGQAGAVLGLLIGIGWFLAVFDA